VQFKGHVETSVSKTETPTDWNSNNKSGKGRTNILDHKLEKDDYILNYKEASYFLIPKIPS